MTLLKITVITAALTLAGCTSISPHASADHHIAKSSHAHNEPTPYDAMADARADVAAATGRAAEMNKMTIVAMGANWCHDSRAFAAQFEKPRFTPLLKDHFELVYVDVGQKNRNIDVAQEYGFESIAGTPTVIILSPDGKVLNQDTAPTWRNAASRTEDEVFEYFEDFTR